MKYLLSLLAFSYGMPCLAAEAPAAAPEILGRDIQRSLPGNENQPKQAPIRVGQELDIAETPSASERDVFVGAVNIAGLTEIPRLPLMASIEPFLGKSASTEDLRAIAQSLANAARSMGYVFATAYIPEQQPQLGMITVKVDEGRVDQVRIVGSSNRKLVKILERLVGPAVRKADLERALLLAGDIPGITVRQTRHVREGKTALLLVEVQENKVRGVAAIDSFGSKTFGPVRARLEFDLTNLLTDGDELSVLALATPVAVSELKYVQARYTHPIGSDGTTVALTGAAGRTGATYSRLGGIMLDGESLYGALSASHPLVRSNQASMWLKSELAMLKVEQSVFGLTFQRDEIVTFGASAHGDVRLAGGRLSGGLGITFGLPLGGTTREGDVLASRSDGSARFTKGTAWANWYGTVTGRVSLRLSAQAQLASRALLAPQEMGAGGAGFGRAYDFSERFGDEGVLGLAEVRYTFGKPTRWLDWAHIYAFADGGYVHNLAGGPGDGTLISTGAGLRGGKGPFDFAVEAAVPLTADRSGTGNRDPRFNFAAGVTF